MSAAKLLNPMNSGETERERERDRERERVVVTVGIMVKLEPPVRIPGTFHGFVRLLKKRHTSLAPGKARTGLKSLLPFLSLSFSFLFPLLFSLFFSLFLFSLSYVEKSSEPQKRVERELLHNIPVLHLAKTFSATSLSLPLSLSLSMSAVLRSGMARAVRAMPRRATEPPNGFLFNEPVSRRSERGKGHVT
jgi:hypothetical protein